MSEARQGGSVIERILGRDAPRMEPEVGERDLRDAFEEVRAPRTRGREALMLDVRKADGARFGLSYAYLTRVDYEPGDLLKLHFADAVVQVGGRGLSTLYDRLLEHRVETIQEGTEAEEGLKPDEAPHIDRIGIFTRTEERDDAHFSDRRRLFRRDRGRCFSVIVDDHGSARVKGFIVSQPSTMTLKR